MIGLLSIYWDVDPAMFYIGSWGFRYYSLFFATGFIIGWAMFWWFFKREGKPDDPMTPLLFVVAFSALAGARLGQCIFYRPEYYFGSLEGFWEIFQPWKGGASSHGAAVGVLIGIWLFSKFYSRKRGIDFLWIMDHMMIPVCFAGTLIRIGNFFNSEIYGPVTDLPWGVVFARAGQTLPHHPTQLYEAVVYCILGFVLLWLYKHRTEKIHKGFLLGLFALGCFGSRFLLEFIKIGKPVVDLGFTTLNIRQLLCIPFIFTGVFLLIYARAKKTPVTKGVTTNPDKG